MCAVGYSGVLCNSCVLDKATGLMYMRSGTNSCDICPNTAVNTLRILGVFFALLLVIFFMIWLNI